MFWNNSVKLELLEKSNFKRQRKATQIKNDKALTQAMIGHGKCVVLLTKII